MTWNDVKENRWRLVPNMPTACGHIQVSEKLVLELAALIATAVLVALGRLDPSVFLTILAIIFGERVYVAVRKRK